MSSYCRSIPSSVPLARIMEIIGLLLISYPRLNIPCDSARTSFFRRNIPYDFAFLPQSTTCLHRGSFYSSLVFFCFDGSSGDYFSDHTSSLMYRYAIICLELRIGDNMM
ncbi:hypothetical protein SAY87_009422 [Trapa incisa]|uniref:Uncharacterized protein n=1 Tax=Trapa incisa TaxID=236973 RepID=A0AAN7K0Q8_9MYRT|nr:hypothetical protein SAY87_009422 [Trapa incisa]